jgi:hypothetical protein
MFNVMKASNAGERRFEMKLSDRDEFVPEASLLEAIQGFSAATDIVFEYLEGWAFTKDHPEEVAAFLRRHGSQRSQDA